MIIEDLAQSKDEPIPKERKVYGPIGLISFTLVFGHKKNKKGKNNIKRSSYQRN